MTAEFLPSASYPDTMRSTRFEVYGMLYSIATPAFPGTEELPSMFPMYVREFFQARISDWGVRLPNLSNTADAPFSSRTPSQRSSMKPSLVRLYMIMRHPSPCRL